MAFFIYNMRLTSRPALKKGQQLRNDCQHIASLKKRNKSVAPAFCLINQFLFSLCGAIQRVIQPGCGIDPVQQQHEHLQMPSRKDSSISLWSVKDVLHQFDQDQSNSGCPWAISVFIFKSNKKKMKENSIIYIYISLSFFHLGTVLRVV